MLSQLSGTLGAVLTGACCLGFAPLLAALGALGLGFLVRDAILIPLLALFLAFALWSLWRSRARHGQSGPFRLAATSALITFAALWVLAPLGYIGLLGLATASAWDILALRRRRVPGGTAGVP